MTDESRGGKLNARGKPQVVLEPLLDVQAVAQLLGVNVRHVRRLVFERRIPYIKWGRLVRFDRHELVGWLEQQRR